jgi:CO/xanthine dehydrogenase FAD-binding subunit
MPVGDLVLGNRKTALQPGEILAALDLPKPATDCRTSFLKLGARRYLVISIVAAALRVDIAEGRIALARVAVGACSAAAKRLPALEAALVGRALSEAAGAVEPSHFAPLSPIDDIRGSSGYRLDTVVTLVRRGLADLSA